MTAKELAERLDGSNYELRGQGELVKQAKADGLVIVYGASDDLMEFDGAIDDEVGVFEGGKVYLNGQGPMRFPGCDPEWRECPYYLRERERARVITAVWCDNDVAWTYKTDIPHETFNIYEDGELYCVGIVFDIKELQEKGVGN